MEISKKTLIFAAVYLAKNISEPRGNLLFLPHFHEVQPHFSQDRHITKQETSQLKEYAYRSRKREKGRSDNTINVCEMKYSKGKYALDTQEMANMQNRVDTLQAETGTPKTILLTLITSNGVSNGSDTHNIQNMLTMDDLFT